MGPSVFHWPRAVAFASTFVTRPPFNPDAVDVEGGRVPFTPLRTLIVNPRCVTCSASSSRTLRRVRTSPRRRGGLRRAAGYGSRRGGRASARAWPKGPQPGLPPRPNGAWRSESRENPPALLQDGSLDPLDAPVGLGTPGPDEDVVAVAALDGGGELRGAELRGVVAHDLLEAPASARKILGDPTGEGRGVVGRRILGRDVYLRPGEGGGDVDGGVLPGSPFDPRKAPEVEAVHLHQLPGAGDVEVALLRGLFGLLGFRRGGGPGDQREALGRGVEAMALEHRVDAVG